MEKIIRSKEAWVVLIVSISAICFSAFLYFYVLSNPDYCNCDGCKMYNDRLNGTITRGILGIYYPGEYYCVWVNGRDFEDINKTEYHEVCHHLVYEDYEHFCKESIGGNNG